MIDQKLGTAPVPLIIFFILRVQTIYVNIIQNLIIIKKKKIIGLKIYLLLIVILLEPEQETEPNTINETMYNDVIKINNLLDFVCKRKDTDRRHLNIDRCENTDVLSGSNITALLGQK